MWPQFVVFASPTRDEDLRLRQRREDLAVRWLRTPYSGLAVTAAVNAFDAERHGHPYVLWPRDCGLRVDRPTTVPPCPRSSRTPSRGEMPSHHKHVVAACRPRLRPLKKREVGQGAPRHFRMGACGSPAASPRDRRQSGKADRGALGGPGWLRARQTAGRQLAHVRAIGPHRVDLITPIAGGMEGDPGSIRGPSGENIPRIVIRQLTLNDTWDGAPSWSP